MEAIFADVDSVVVPVTNKIKRKPRKPNPNARKTHCKRGHLLSGDNLKTTKRGFRGCKACARLSVARHRAAKQRSLGSAKFSSYPPVDEAKAARILAALRDGKTLNIICAGKVKRRYVGAPERITDYIRFREYCEAHPDFSQEALALLAENTKAANARKGEYHRSRTHCPRGHLYPANRKCKACAKFFHENPKLPTDDQIQRVTAALNAGQTIGVICRGKIGDKKVSDRIVDVAKLMQYRKLNPEYDRFVCSAIAGNTQKGLLRRFNPQLYHANVLRAERNDYHAIVDVAPANLPPDIRDDIVQSIFMALLEGSLRRDQVKERVRQFVTAHNRDANRHGTGKFGLVSLDAPVFAESSTRLGDTITRGLWD